MEAMLMILPAERGISDPWRLADRKNAASRLRFITLRQAASGSPPRRRPVAAGVVDEDVRSPPRPTVRIDESGIWRLGDSPRRSCHSDPRRRGCARRSVELVLPPRGESPPAPMSPSAFGHLRPMPASAGDDGDLVRSSSAHPHDDPPPACRPEPIARRWPIIICRAAVRQARARLTVGAECRARSPRQMARVARNRPARRSRAGRTPRDVGRRTVTSANPSLDVHA